MTADETWCSEGMEELDTMTAPEVAKLLRVGRNAIYDLVGQNKIPHRRVGRLVRFSRVAISRWLEEDSLSGRRAS